MAFALGSEGVISDGKLSTYISLKVEEILNRLLELQLVSQSKAY